MISVILCNINTFDLTEFSITWRSDILMNEKMNEKQGNGHYLKIMHTYVASKDTDLVGGVITN
jgi:hypothetical protein